MSKKLQIKKGELFPTDIFGNSKKEIIEDKKILIKDNKTKEKIFDAIKKNDIRKIRKFKSMGFDFNVRSKHYNWTPIMVSVMNNCEKITLLLLDEKIDINAQNEFGSTALHHTYSSSYNILERILNKKANVNIRDLDEKTPIMEILYHEIDRDGKTKNDETIKKIDLLLNKLVESDYSEKLHHAIELFKVNSSRPHYISERIIETIKKIAKEKKNINKENKEGNTPLLILTQTNIPIFQKIDIIKSLVENGAKVSIKNYEGKEPIDYVNDFEKEVKTLLETIKWLEDKKRLI
jgi:ankyrin repeat protein